MLSLALSERQLKPCVWNWSEPKICRLERSSPRRKRNWGLHAACGWTCGRGVSWAGPGHAAQLPAATVATEIPTITAGQFSRTCSLCEALHGHSFDDPLPPFHCTTRPSEKFNECSTLKGINHASISRRISHRSQTIGQYEEASGYNHGNRDRSIASHRILSTVNVVLLVGGEQSST